MVMWSYENERSSIVLCCLFLQEELSRKRKAPVASSVVRVSRTLDEDSDDLDEDDTSYGGRGVSSRVSLPSKPERKSVFKPAVVDTLDK